MRRALAIAVLTLVAATPVAAAGPTPPLGHDGRWITDARGRVVILHGVNMVYKVPPYYPKAGGFGLDDARFLHRHGLDTVRLGAIYKGVEPRPPANGHPRYDDGYLRKLAKTERLLGRRGIFSLVDFHQDLYNERFQGEGWPDWQVEDDGAPNPQNGFPANYLTNEAMNRAYDHFWNNDEVGGVKLQSEYAKAWRHVAARFGRRPYVLGYDLLNEPWPGSMFPACIQAAGCPTFDATTLTEFTKRVISSIRKVDRRTLTFYEPLLTFDFGAQTSMGDTGDPQAGFSFHDYCLPGAFGGPGSGDACSSPEDLVFQNADARADQVGDALLLTEFGASNDLDDIGRIVTLADDHMTSWQYWHYCACDDPTTSGPGVQALVIDASKPPRKKNVKWRKLKVLDRPYPQAVAGTPTEFLYDPDANEFNLEYTTKAPDGGRLPARLATIVYVPHSHYLHGYDVQVDGATVVSAADARYLKLRRSSGSRDVTVTVSPVQ
jgi:endoglycosylceramidase